MMHPKAHFPLAPRWLLVLAILVLSVMLPVAAVAQADTIDAVVRGTSTQLGEEVSIKLVINHYSTPQEKQTLVQAFQQGGTKGLVQALSKMKPAGQLQIRGGVGYDVVYISTTPTPTGRKVRFITNRWLKFFESFYDTRSQAYDLTAGEFDIDNQNAKQSTGVLYPASELVINRQGDLEWQLFANPWQVTNIIDWNAKKKG